MRNILGIDTPGGHRLRVPLSVEGAVTCAAEIPHRARVHVMKASSSSATEAAADATRVAVTKLRGALPAAALLFDFRLGEVFGFELQAVQEALGGSDLVGCNTYGQIVRSEGQFGGFHNCTAVVFALPQ